MKKRWNKLIALLMLSCIVTAGFPMYQVNAEEASTGVTEENTVAPEETETNSDSDFEESVIEKNQNQINYVFVENPYLESPGTERIAVSYGDGSESIQSLSMIVESEDGEQEVWESSDNVNNLYLFEKAFSDESQTGTYSVIGFNLVYESGTYEVELSDYGMEALFGVNEEYEGIEELQPLDEDAAEAQALEQDESAYSATVVQIDSENPNKSVKEIESALEDAEENVDSESGIAEISELSELSESVRSVVNARSNNGNIVVALDPGHDSKHTGATGIGGLKEEVLTLKIANYCKQELEKYAGVSVYMTRTTASCPYPSNRNSGGDIGDRVQAAANAGADLFVSFHLNSSGASGSKGAEVIVPNNNWKPQVASEGRKLAQAILNELKSVGVSMRPTAIYSRDTTISEYYKDGSKSDYFSVQIYAKEAGIPGIIVEHAFLTNSGDVNNYLNSEAGLKKLGVADATGIAKYLGVSVATADTGWRTIDGNTYYYVNGQPVTGERQIGGYWYYFDSNGIMQTGFVDLGHKVVYYNGYGRMQYGEQQIDGYWYFFDRGSGAMEKGFVDLGHKVVYYNGDGHMLYGEQQIDGYWYFFDWGSGAVQRGFVDLGYKVVYYNSYGRMQYGEQQIDGYWYFFDRGSGAVQRGFVDLGHKVVYYNGDGHMQYGEQQIDGYWYFFDTGSGAMERGFVDLGHKVVYYNGYGRMQYGEQQIDGYWYFFDRGSGAMQRGFVDLGHKVVYYNSYGRMQYGEQQIDGYWYFFDRGSGAMQRGFVDLGHKVVYYTRDGHMQYGEQQIDDNWYYFDTGSGAMQTNTIINGKYYDKKGKYQELHGIVGNPTTTAEKMVQFYNNRNVSYPTEKLSVGGADSIEKLATIFYEEATAEGIDPAIAWCQTMKETNWLRFGGQVKIDQFNFAGIGATDGGAAGADFSSYGTNGVRMGVRAQIQHLKAYAVSGLKKTDLKNDCVDPRFAYVKKGSAAYVEWLGIQENPTGAGWATDTEYGYSIIKDYVKKLWTL